eukprot:14132067-Ditylum_brightwellii.AAC.1
MYSTKHSEETTPILPMQTKPTTEKPFKLLSDCIFKSPQNLHSVLVITDGSSTDQKVFLPEIDKFCLGFDGFLQIDPLFVTHLTTCTGGDALLVESLKGTGTQKRLLGMLSRSLICGASQLAINVEQGKLLAIMSRGDDLMKPPLP